MPIFEIEQQGELYEVEAPDEETALRAFNPNFKLPNVEPEEVAVETPRPLTREEQYRGGQQFGRRMIRGAIAQPVSGIAALMGLAAGGLDTAVAWKEGVESKITGAPSSREEAAFAAQFVESPLVKGAAKVAEVADEELLKLSGRLPRALSKGNPAAMLADVAMRRAAGEDQDENTINAVAAGNPMVATLLKTAIVGGPEIFALKGMDIPRRAMVAKRVRKSNARVLKDVTDEAEKMGLRLSNDELIDSTLEVADMMAPDRHKAAVGGELQTALQDAATAAEGNIDVARTLARETRGYVPAKALSELGEDLQNHLISTGFDVAKMPEVKSVIRDMRRATRVIPGAVSSQKNISAISLNQIDLLRRRISKGIKNNGSDSDSALRSVRHELDRHIQDQFDADAIRGNPEAHAKWQEVRSLSEQYERTFDADDTIRRIISKDASPEDVYRWVIGANAQNAKIGAAVVVKRMKNILGPNHPAIVGMRNAAMRDIFVPLFADKPNFKTAIKNIDNLMQNNYSLMNELAIPRDKLLAVRQAAHASQFVKASTPAILQKRWLSRLAASLIWGHDLAKRARIVQLGHKAIDLMIGTGVLQRGDIVKHLAEGGLRTPIKNIPSKRLGAFLGGAALADIGTQTAEEYEDGDVVGVEER